MSSYNNRQDFELSHWPELQDTFLKLVKTIQSDRGISRQQKIELFTMASQASGCLHCQSHGAFRLNSMGVDTDRIRAIWEYETSDLFTAGERAALDLVRSAALSPNAATPEHFEELRKHYSNEQIIEILAVNCLAGWLNRWNDTIATVTDQESVDFATENLSDLGWHAGKHTGDASEQRKAHPVNVGWVEPEKKDS